MRSRSLTSCQISCWKHRWTKVAAELSSGKRENVHIAPLNSRVILSKPQPLTIFIMAIQNYSFNIVIINQ